VNHNDERPLTDGGIVDIHAVIVSIPMLDFIPNIGIRIGRQYGQKEGKN
jgi:hypothetical protein